MLYDYIDINHILQSKKAQVSLNLRLELFEKKSNRKTKHICYNTFRLYANVTSIFTKENI
jgi:hypothetical protein